VHAVSGAIVEAGATSRRANSSPARTPGRFFIRLQVESPAARTELEAALGPVIERYGMHAVIDVVGRPCALWSSHRQPGHCVNDLLYRRMRASSPSRSPWC
jgi:formyltetrahydrofolate deformylase